MVASQSPSNFYGSSLPRPRIYTPINVNEPRVDPPLSVVDPLISWAQEAHWSTGGLSFHRHRLQGRIEGSVEKLRAEQETAFKKMPISQNLRVVEKKRKRRRLVKGLKSVAEGVAVEEVVDEMTVEKVVE